MSDEQLVVGDPRPQRVAKASPAEWRRIRRAKVTGQPCRACGVSPLVVSAHHLLGGKRREDLEDAIVPLGGSGTMLCHGIYTSRWTGESCDGKRRTWGEVASNIRATLTEEEIAYVVSRVGEIGLERLYPRRPTTHHHDPQGGADAA